MCEKHQEVIVVLTNFDMLLRMLIDVGLQGLLRKLKSTLTSLYRVEDKLYSDVTSKSDMVG